MGDWFRLAPPDDFDWDNWYEELKVLYRYHQNRRHIIALNILDNVYDEWQKGRRSIAMIEAVNEVHTVDTEYINCDVDW